MNSEKTVAVNGLSIDRSTHLLRNYATVERRSIKILVGWFLYHLDSADPAANAVEIRILRRLIPEIANQLEWYDSLGLENTADPWQEYIRALLQNAGGISGFGEKSPPPTPFASQPFRRARTIHFDDCIRIGALTPYDQRQRLAASRATVEQFKVFFNELYAAALLSSVLFDAFDDGHPWEFYADMRRHFWDEVQRAILAA